MIINVPDDEQMELICIYIGHANGEEYDLHLDFSQDIQVRYNKNKQEITVTELEFTNLDDFFGQYVSNISIIAGKNGAGKSTILGFLTYIDAAASSYVLEYFAVFRLGNRIFLEGMKYQEALYINKLNMGVQRINNDFAMYINRKIPMLYFDVMSSMQYKKKTADSCYLDMSIVRDSTRLNDFDFLSGVNQWWDNSFVEHFGKSHRVATLNIYTYIEYYEKLGINTGQNFGGFLEMLRVDKIGDFENSTTGYVLIFLRKIIGFILITIFLNANKNSLKGGENLINTLVWALLDDKQQSPSRIELDTKIYNVSQALKDVCNFYIADINSHNRWVSNIQEFAVSLANILEKNMVNVSYSRDKYSFFIKYDSRYQNDMRLIVKYFDDFEKNIYQPNMIKQNLSSSLFLDCSFGNFSSGEWQIIKQFSRLHTNINQLEKDKLMKSCILLIDECETLLHPEWSRKYLSYLLKFLDAEGERLGIQFQVILTTHSPYLISDLPKENIILLEKDEKTGKRTARKSNYGFASNYYDIMSDSFFLDDTIGEFAKQKINGCIQAINRISDDLDKLANDELILHDGLSIFIKESLENIEEQNKVIDLVGDKFIQKQLQQLSDSVKQRLLIHSDDSVRKQQLEQDIAELEERIRQKKMELNND